MKKKKVLQKSPVSELREKPFFLINHPLISVIVVTALVITIMYFPVLFGGKSFQSSDKLTSRAVNPFVEKARAQGITPLWCPYIFSGMPSFGSMLSAININPIDEPIKRFLNSLDPGGGNKYEFWFQYINFLIFSIFLYLLARKGLKLNPLAAILSSLAVVILPQFVAFVVYGHNSKFLAVVLIPLIFYLTIKLLEKKNTLYFSLLALAIGFQMLRVHIQVSYYTFLMMGIYFIYKMVADYRTFKNLKSVVSSTAIFVGAILVGVLLSMVLYASVFDYQRFSIRGGESGGLDYGYAANWSFHPLEMITFFIPSFMGFGGETYWGKMPFTDYPLYFGIIIFFLAGFAFLLKRDRMTWVLGIVVIFSLFVSFGKHLPILYTPMFKFLPFFDKFRVPSMIHIILDIGMVLLAAIGLDAVIEFHNKNMRTQDREAMVKSIKKYSYIFVLSIIVLVIFLLIGKSFYLDLAGSGNVPLNNAQRVLAYNKALMDGFKSIILLIVCWAIILQFIAKKISKGFLGLSVLILVIIDLWMVDFKIIHAQPLANEKRFFEATPIVNYLQQDKSLFRIFPVLDDKSGNWYMRHFIQNISGYSAAKLRIYQDFLDETGFGSQDRYGLNSFISKYWRIGMRDNRVTPMEVPLDQIAPQRLAFDSAVLDMLNVKYLIVQYLPLNDPRYRPIADRQQLPIYENTTALPRVFFVDSTVTIRGRKAIFDFMKSGKFDPHKVAILEESPPFPISSAKGNSAEIVKYDIHEIQISAKNANPTLLVLSEIYYPAGWKAIVDGVETKIYKTNYLLRSIFLPAGEHNIVFRFEPSSYFIGKWLSTFTLLALLGLLGVSGWQMIKDKNIKSSDQKS